MSGPELVLLAVGAYALAGVLFGVVFVAVGVARLDPAARGTSWAFRALILPGSATLWPLLVMKWARHKGAA
ncbi:MAG TPA: hypothetical protein VGE74_13995 [Gemmata sp.]